MYHNSFIVGTQRNSNNHDTWKEKQHTEKHFMKNYQMSLKKEPDTVHLLSSNLLCSGQDLAPIKHEVKLTR